MICLISGKVSPPSGDGTQSGSLVQVGFSSLTVLYTLIIFIDKEKNSAIAAVVKFLSAISKC
jgi:hypothetical protein